MAFEVLKGKWNELEGSARQEWAKLTDDDLQEVQGDGQKLMGKLQQAYGYSKAEAEQKVNDWLSKN